MKFFVDTADIKGRHLPNGRRWITTGAERDLKMRATPPLKKNSSIEVRLPDRTKTAFMERCQREGRTASDVVRALIDEQLQPAPAARKNARAMWRMAVAGVTGAALGLGLAAPSIASSPEPSRAAFERLDRDGDGALTFEEFKAR